MREIARPFTGVVARTRATRVIPSASRGSSPTNSPGPSSTGPCGSSTVTVPSVMMNMPEAG